jgi:hypothetical protein
VLEEAGDDVTDHHPGMGTRGIVVVLPDGQFFEEFFFRELADFARGGRSDEENLPSPAILVER